MLLRFIVDIRINETLQIGRRCFQLRRFNPPNGVYAVRLETAPTGERKCLFIFRIHHSQRSIFQVVR